MNNNDSNSRLITERFSEEPKIKETRAQRRSRERATVKRKQKAAGLLNRLKIAAKNGDQKEIQKIRDRLSELRNSP